MPDMSSETVWLSVLTVPLACNGGAGGYVDDHVPPNGDYTPKYPGLKTTFSAHDQNGPVVR